MERDLAVLTTTEGRTYRDYCHTEPGERDELLRRLRSRGGHTKDAVENLQACGLLPPDPQYLRVTPDPDLAWRVDMRSRHLEVLAEKVARGEKPAGPTWSVLARTCQLLTPSLEPRHRDYPGGSD